MDKPYVVDETDNYAVVFKPAKMHSESMHSESLAKEFAQSHKGAKGSEGVATIYDWYLEILGYKEDVRLMHRLDFETNGLVLFAKNEKSFNFFKELQDSGEFIKEYSAICVPAESNMADDGFPDNNFVPSCLREKKFAIESYFRPYGPGRKQVRPVVDIPKKHKEIAKDKGGFYKTEIIDVKDSEEKKVFTVQIKRGFRHQIRCHLCWAGFPILNDPLYSHIEAQPSGLLALRSHALFFADPVSGEKRECSITPLQ